MKIDRCGPTGQEENEYSRRNSLPVWLHWLEGGRPEATSARCLLAVIWPCTTASTTQPPSASGASLQREGIGERKSAHSWLQQRQLSKRAGDLATWQGLLVCAREKNLKITHLSSALFQDLGSIANPCPQRNPRCTTCCTRN